MFKKAWGKTDLSHFCERPSAHLTGEKPRTRSTSLCGDTAAANTSVDFRSSLSHAILVIVSFTILMVFSVSDFLPRCFYWLEIETNCISLNLSCTSLLRHAPSGSVRSVCILPKTDIHRSCNSFSTWLPSMFPTCSPSAQTCPTASSTHIHKCTFRV